MNFSAGHEYAESGHNLPSSKVDCLYWLALYDGYTLRAWGSQLRRLWLSGLDIDGRSMILYPVRASRVYAGRHECSLKGAYGWLYWCFSQLHGCKGGGSIWTTDGVLMSRNHRGLYGVKRASGSQQDTRSTADI